MIKFPDIIYYSWFKIQLPLVRTGSRVLNPAMTVPTGYAVQKPLAPAFYHVF
jgi:hypothetical protein